MLRDLICSSFAGVIIMSSFCTKINKIGLVNAIFHFIQEVLERNSLAGTKIWLEINRSIEQARSESDFCHCLKTDGCNNCLRRRVVNLLRDKGLTATLCTSKWRDTKKFPRGNC